MDFLTFYRISLATNGADLSGKPAKKYGGRFNIRGMPAVYAASSISLATLEFMTLANGVPLSGYSVLALRVPMANISCFSVGDMPEGWSCPSDQKVAQQFIAKQLLVSGVFGVVVPSVITPEESHIVLNPRHPKMREATIVRLRPLVPSVSEGASAGAGSLDEVTGMKNKASVYAALNLPFTQKVEAVRQGFPADEIASVIDDLGMNKRQLFAVLRVPERTGSRLIDEHRQLDSNSSERLLRLVEIVRYAETVFGNKQRALQWIGSHHTALLASPVDMLDTEIGATQVRQILMSIEHGLPV